MQDTVYSSPEIKIRNEDFLLSKVKNSMNFRIFSLNS